MTDSESDQPLPLEAPPIAAEAEPTQPAGEITPEPVAAPTPGEKSDWLRPAGIVLALLGAGLAAAPHVSHAAAQLLARLVAPELYGGLLISAGLGLYLGGLLRRSLGAIRGSLADLRSETSRLDALSCDTRVLCQSVEQIQLADQDLKLGVADLQKRIQRLAEIASDPEHTVSMFRLAASVDQLGARLDLFIKDQFKHMRQQLNDVVAQTQQADQDLGVRLAQLLEEHREENAKTAAGIGKQLADTRATLSSAVVTMDLERKSTSAAQKEMLQALREHVELRLQEHTTYVAECLGQLDGAVERSGQARDALANELAARLGGQLAEQSSGLERSLVPLAEAVRRGEQAGASLVSLLAGLETHVADQHQALQIALHEGLEQLQACALQTGASSAEGVQAAARIEARLQDCQENLGRAFAATREDWQRGAAAWNSGLEQLGGTLERSLAEQLSSVGGRLERIDGKLDGDGRRNEDRAARDVALVEQLSSLGGRIERIDSRLDGDGRRNEQHAARAAALAEQLAAVGGRLEEIDGKLDGDGRRNEEREARAAALAEQLAAVGGRLEEIDGKLDGDGRRNDEHVARAAALAEQLAAVGGRLEQIDGRLDDDGRRNEEREARAAALVERLENGIAGNSAGLARMADELAALASLAEEVRAAFAAEPVASPRELALVPPDAPEALDAPAPSAAVAPELEPPPALPTTVHDYRSDLTP